MTIKKTVVAALVCGSVAFVSFACSNHEDAKESAETMNNEKFDNTDEKEADKLVNAYSANLYEIKASEYAAMNATNMKVKSLGAMMVEAHTKMNEEVKKLAVGKDVTLPTGLSDEQQKDLQKLSEKSATDYNKAYVEQMKEKHEKALDFYQKIADKCDDASMKSWAAKTVTEVRSHMDMVLTTYNEVKDTK